MLSDTYTERLVSGVSNGRYALLIGAGFSHAASSTSGERLPLGQALADELAEKFGQDGGHPLSRLWEALPKPAREQYLCGRFKGCIVPADLYQIKDFVWRAIYNLNVDDVVEIIYDSELRQQDLELVTPATPFSTPESLAQLRCIHLHGSVLKPEAGFVFSTSEYAASTTTFMAWGPVLADDLAVTPFIVIGCSLDEYDLEHHLARRGDIDVERDPCPSLFITTNADSVTRATAERHGMIVVEATAVDFLNWLKSKLPCAPSPLDLLVPRSAKNLYQEEPHKNQERVFYRQFLHVVEEELPRQVDPVNFLRGTEPVWQDFVDNNDVIRRDVTLLIDRIRKSLEADSSQNYLEIIESSPGGGKSAVLKRAALELSRLGFPVFFFCGTERLSPVSTEACISRMKRPPVLFVDPLVDHCDQVLQLADKMNGSRHGLFVVGADRGAAARMSRIKLTDFRQRSKKMDNLSRSEAKSLVAQMRAEGLLGLKARLSNKDLVARAQKKDLLVAICEIASDGSRFDDLVLSIWDAASAPIQSFLAKLVVASALGYPLKFSIAQANTRCTVGDLKREIASGCLSYVVFSEGLNGEYLRVAHRVLAERLADVAIPSDIQFSTFVDLAKGLAPYVTRSTIRQRTQEARLAGRLLDYEPNVRDHIGERASEFYKLIHTQWAWNSRYWEQRGLLEVQEGDVRIAITYAEQAVGIERHPHTMTTLGKILMRAAVVSPQDGPAAKLFERACEALRDSIEMRRGEHLWRDASGHHVAINGSINYYTRRRLPVSTDVSEWIDELLRDRKRGPRGDIDWDRLGNQWSNLPR